MLLFSSADFLQNKVFENKPHRTTIRVSNSLNPDQDGHSVGLHLGSNVCKRLLANDKIIHWHAKSYNRFNILSPIGIYMHMYTIHIRTLKIHSTCYAL